MTTITMILILLSGVGLCLAIMAATIGLVYAAKYWQPTMPKLALRRPRFVSKRLPITFGYICSHNGNVYQTDQPNYNFCWDCYTWLPYHSEKPNYGKVRQQVTLTVDERTNGDSEKMRESVASQYTLPFAHHLTVDEKTVAELAAIQNAKNNKPKKAKKGKQKQQKSNQKNAKKNGAFVGRIESVFANGKIAIITSACSLSRTDRLSHNGQILDIESMQIDKVDTDLVVAGENAGLKLSKAVKAGDNLYKVAA